MGSQRIGHDCVTKYIYISEVVDISPDHVDSKLYTYADSKFILFYFFISLEQGFFKYF